MSESSTPPLLRVHKMSASYRRGGDWHSVLSDVSLDIARGELVGLVGESGSGKSTLASLLMGERRGDRRITAGSVTFDGIDLFAADRATLQHLLGARLAIVPQNSGASLTPTMRIEALFRETLRRHRRKLGAAAIRQATLSLLEEVGLAEVPGAMSRFPHEFSGGQQQRLALALAFICNPDLVVLDEPTTGLDPIIRRSIVTLLRRLCRDHGVAMLFVSHDLETVADLCVRTAVMQRGEIVEDDLCATIFSAPRHPYTRSLLALMPSIEDEKRADDMAVGAAADLLHVQQVSFRYDSHKRVVQALQAVTFSIGAGEVVAVIGESGSGKSTLARIVSGLLPAESGRLIFKGRDISVLAGRRPATVLRQIQIVFQNPDGSLNPRHTVSTILGKPLRRFLCLRGRPLRARVEELLAKVRLPAQYADRYPSELSGGERQRVAIARALAAEPDLLICDEITSALDVSVKASSLDLLKDVQRQTGIAILFVTHDLPVVWQFADRAVVLYRGRLCEDAPVSRIFSQPEADYTASLIQAVRQMPRWTAPKVDQPAGNV